MKQKIKNLKLYNKHILLGIVTAIGISEGGRHIIEFARKYNSDINANEYSIEQEDYNFPAAEEIENSEISTEELDLSTEEKEEIKVINKVEDSIKKYPKNTYGYIVKDTELEDEYDENAKKDKIEKYQKVQLIEKIDSYILVKGDNKKGYIEEKNVEAIDSDFVDVDISSQKIIYYDINGKKVLSSSVVTGLASSDDRKTPVGMYDIYTKQLDRILRGANYSSHVDYWMPFYEGYGLHDANWRGEFGGEIYKTNGSHGCVNLPNEVAKELYEEVEIGTKVLVHK